MFPTKEVAFSLLFDAERCNPGPWVMHSIAVAKCAMKIAQNCGMDMDKAYILGLLHDIGRKYGKSDFRHIAQGYTYMNTLGYDEVAQICLTHSFTTQCIEDYCGTFDVSDELLITLRQKLMEVTYDDYDRLIMLCDCLCSANGIVDMCERMDDVERRYGPYPPNKRQEYMKLRYYFEQKAGQNIYKIVTTNKSLWTL